MAIFKKNNNPLTGEITIPSDKSITHRALIFSALLKDKIKIKNISLGQDCLNTLNIFKSLGVKYEFLSKKEIIVDSSKGFNLDKDYTFDCGNSGTTTRLLAGLFSGIEGLNCTLIGDNSLSKRPMKRVIEPLSLMGADIKSNDFKIPLEIKGKKLNPITYKSKIASAQVKSSILLAGLNTNGVTKTFENHLSRNHSELMLEYLKANIKTGKEDEGYFAKIEKSNLKAKDIEIVGDISSAAFFMVAAAIVPNSKILIKNVGINPTRSGILDIFKQSCIKYSLLNKKTVSNEPIADILVEYTSNIKPFIIQGDIVPRLIDEIPILSVLAAYADGKSIIKDASDLRNKESDRIKNMVDALNAFGIKTIEKDDGFEIEGNKKGIISKDITFETHLDHRLAMSYFILSLLNEKNTEILNFDCTNTSFPEFLDLFKDLGYDCGK